MRPAALQTHLYCVPLPHCNTVKRLNFLCRGDGGLAAQPDERGQERVGRCQLRFVLDGSVEVAELVVTEFDNNLLQERDGGVEIS